MKRRPRIFCSYITIRRTRKCSGLLHVQPLLNTGNSSGQIERLMHGQKKLGVGCTGAPRFPVLPANRRQESMGLPLALLVLSIEVSALEGFAFYERTSSSRFEPGMSPALAGASARALLLFSVDQAELFHL